MILVTLDLYSIYCTVCIDILHGARVSMTNVQISCCKISMQTLQYFPFGQISFVSYSVCE